MYDDWSSWRYPTTVDFETEAIDFDRPDLPPRPVGVSIKYWKKPAVYYAWGHRVGNNCTKEEAIQALKIAFNHSSILCHNTKFEMSVFCGQLGLPMVPPKGYHDTALMAFLMNPHEVSLGLKPLADKYLDMAPEERDAVAEWLCENQESFNYLYTKSGEKPPLPSDRQKFSVYASGRVKPQALNWSGWGAYIWEAPGKLVGKYANGDTIRTEKLFDFWFDKIIQTGQLEAYKRELEIMPMLLENQMHGIRVDVEKLRRDEAIYKKCLEDIDRWLCKECDAPEDTNWNSGDQIVKALEACGKVDPDDWVIPEGKKKISVDKDHLPLALHDEKLCNVFRVRSIMKTSYANFIRNWLRTAESSGGRIFTWWNQVRNEDGGGARTGRFSTTPNFQNAPKKPWQIVFTKKESDRLHREEENHYLLPKSMEKFMVEFPRIRNYMIPDADDEVLLCRDYDGQEIRVLAHFEDGDLKLKFMEDPNLDLHQFVTDMVNNYLGTHFSRKQIKIVVFGIIYGMGLKKLAKSLECEFQEAKEMKNTIMKLFPGLDKLDKRLKNAGKHGDPMITWGGRVYYVEPPAYVDGQLRTFEYKILNCLIQGSSADCTKEALRNYGMSNKKSGRFYLTVHDEIVVSVKREYMHIGMERLKDAMSDVGFDIPMLSDGDWSTKSYGQLKKYTGKEAV